MTAQPTILICDDEPVLREMVRDYLGGRGFTIAEAEDAAALHAQIQDTPPDLVVLDVNMPGEDGLSALRTLRAGAAADTPVIMLTAADTVVDRVVGLEMGADDYLGKPVDLRELEARIKAALRRHPKAQAGTHSSAPGKATVQIPFGTCTLDLDGARLLDAQGRDVYITSMEFSLLRVFAENKGRVLNRDQLLEMAHDKTWEPFDRSIDLRISRIRRKIEEHPAKPQVIRTVRGIGYVFG